MHAPTHAQSHIAQAVTAIDSCFPLIMADTARLMWLCACVSYRSSRGLWVVHVSLAFKFVFLHLRQPSNYPLCESR